MIAQDIFTDGRWTAILQMFPRDLEESAQSCGAIERVRNIPCAANLLRMILEYSLSGLSLKDTAARAKADDIANLTAQAVHYRLMRSEDWLECLLGQLLFQHPPENPIGFPIRVADGTVITGPGSKETDWVAHMILGPISGRFQSFELTDAKGGESFCRTPSIPGR